MVDEDRERNLREVVEILRRRATKAEEHGDYPELASSIFAEAYALAEHAGTQQRLDDLMTVAQTAWFVITEVLDGAKQSGLPDEQRFELNRALRRLRAPGMESADRHGNVETTEHPHVDFFRDFVDTARNAFDVIDDAMSRPSAGSR